MVILKDDADKMWCPMVRAIGEDGSGNASIPVVTDTVDHPHRIPKWARCVGDDCMMWRFADDGVVQSIGYCGLAGKPIGV
jgi:hypothetical protein